MITSANVYGVQPPAPQQQPTPVQEAVSAALNVPPPQSTSPVGDFMTRVIGEKSELDQKLVALNGFIKTSPIFPSLHPDEQERMIAQAEIMAEYSDILTQRIQAFRR